MINEKVCCTTDGVEYPATFVTAMPNSLAAFKSILLVPVALTQISFKDVNCAKVSRLNTTLFVIIMSAFWLCVITCSGLVSPCTVSSPSAEMQSREVFASVALSKMVMFTIFPKSVSVKEGVNPVRC